jgi:hypothetical protein
LSADSGPARPVGAPSAPPKPAGWTASRFSAGYTALVVVTAVVAVVTVFGVLAGVFSLDPVAIPAGAFALWLVHLAGFLWHVRWSPRRPVGNATLIPSPDGATKGVRFRYSGRPYYWFTAFLVLLLLLVLAFAGIFVVGGSAVGIAFAVLVGSAVLLLGWFLAVTLRHAPGEVTISPAGIFHQSLTFAHFIPWYAVDGVEARWLGSPVIVVKAYPSEDTGLRSFTGRFHAGDLSHLPFMVIRTHWLATDPATVYHALAYYHAHPDQRLELATPAALDRIASGRATVPTS